MSNIVSMQREIKDLKNTIRQYERMHEKQVNPPVSLVNVDFKAQFEHAVDEINSFKPIPMTGGKLFRKIA